MQTGFAHRGRMLRLLSMMAALAVAGQPATAAPLQPTGKWQVQYSDRACTAKRAFGDYVLAIRPSPLGLTTRFVVEGPGKADRVRQLDSTVELDVGGPVLNSSSLIYPLSTWKRRGLMTILPTADAARVQKAGRFKIWAGEKLAKQADGLPNTPRSMAADVAFGSTAALDRTLDQCVADLRSHWGMTDGKLPEPADAPHPTSKLYNLFKEGDYPADAMKTKQTGDTRAFLMIDEKGKVVDCVTVETSGSASIDAVVCQVIEERAVFKPARDRSNQPIRSTITTPLIRFVIAP